MLQEQEKNETPAILWVDRNIFSDENQCYCSELKTYYPDSFFTINDELKYFEKVKQLQNKKLVILSSGQCAYKLVQMTDLPILIFCKIKQNHFDLFQSNTQIKAIVDHYDEANNLLITCMNHFENIQNLEQLVTPISVTPSPQYQHTKYNISIQFFVVIEEIRKSQKVTDAMLYDEIKNLLSQVMNPELAIERTKKAISDVNYQEKKRMKKMKPYEKLLFLYSLEDLQLYKILNQAFAQYDYQHIKNILVLLLNGFYKMSKTQSLQNYKTLYRGISVQKNIYESIKQDLEESQKKKKSIFWNQLTSTSSKFEESLKFLPSKFSDTFGILFEFELDSNNPHPYLKLPQDLTMYNESEILLFPQFEFVVQGMKIKKEDSKEFLCVYIKQKKNSFAFAIDRKMRNLYWQDVYNNQISPKVKSLVEFCFQRIEQIIQFIIERQSTKLTVKFCLDNEIKNGLSEILKELLKIFSHCKNEQIKNVKAMILLFKNQIKFENQSNNLNDYIRNFQVYFKSIKKVLKTNICSLLLKGMIDTELCLESLNRLGQRFQESKENPNPPTNVNGEQINFSSFEKGITQNTTGLTYQQLRAQKITSIQKVQNSNGTQAYEVTLKDGNRLLMHHNPNNNKILQVSKQIDSQGKVGYTNQWKQVGEPQKIKHLTVEDVQSSIKGKQAKFDLQNVKSIEMTAQMQQARTVGQIGGAIATAAGSLAVDLLIDDFDGWKVGKAAFSAGVQGGLIYLQTAKQMAKAVPYVGMTLAAAMTSISIGQVILSDFLNTSEKYYNALLVTIKTATSIGLGIAGVEGGMVVGAAGGPIGVIVGGIIGGFLGGVGGNLLSRGLDLFTQFQIEFDFGENNKSKVKNGFLVSAGCLPTIKWINVKKKVKCMILIAQSDKHMACIIPNIEPEKGQINDSDKMGVKLKGYRYIGPDDQCKEITFKLFATMDEYVDESEILQRLIKNSLKLIDVAEKKIKF